MNLTRLRTWFRDDTGSSLPEAIIACLVAATMMGAIAAGIIAITSLMRTVLLQSEGVSQVAVVDSRWHADFRTAVKIDVTDATHVTLTLPAVNGGCQQDAWVSDTTGLTVTTTSYPALAGNACSGAAVAAGSSETLMRAGANAVFTYKNSAGRTETFTGGVGTLAPGTKPAATQQAAWDSATVTVGVLDAVSKVNPTAPRTVHSSQIANAILAAGPGTTTAPAAAVPAGQTLLANPLTATSAGTGTSGSADGVASSASFAAPTDLAIDAAGNTWVADPSTNSIRKITAAGVVSTPVTSANVAAPEGVAIGPDGSTVFITDTGHNRIATFTPGTSTFTVIAGAGGTGAYLDGNGTAAKFSAPARIAVSAAGTIYVSDRGNTRIRSITAAAPYTVTTLAGSTSGNTDGVGTAARFKTPAGLALSTDGTTLYVGDSGNNNLRQIAVGTGAVSTVPASTTGLTGDADVTVAADGTLYIADTGAHRIRAISSAGAASTITGTGTAGAAEGSRSATFSAPAGILARPDGALLVADTGNHKIRLIR